LSVVHRTYAKALFEAARERGSLGAVREQFQDFVEVVGAVPELETILRNPQIDRRAKAAALDAVLDEADETLRNFVRLLAEKGRAGEVQEMQREFERLVSAAEGQLDVELTTAYELSDEEAAGIFGQIERVSGRRIQASRTVDPGLIGGMVLRIGSRRVDASVRGRLDRLRRELVQRR
jgi:F-type H+-transporting ATPase subunit delta